MVEKSISKDVAAGISKDLVAWTVAKSKNMEEASLQCNKRALFGLLKHIAPWTPQRDFRICDSSGRPTTSDGEERLVIRDHFDALYDGVHTSFRELIDLERSDAVIHSNLMAPLERSLDVIPTLSFMVCKYSHAKMNGTGEIVIGGEATKIAPRPYALAHHPLHVKAALYCRYPEHWLGGCISALYKGRGTRASIRSYRDITLADGEGKAFQSFLRFAMLGATSLLVGRGQCGAGLNAGATDICSLMINQSFAKARAERRSCGALFADVVSAFASIVRRSVFEGLPDSEEGWRRNLLTAGFDLESIDEIIKCSVTTIQWTEAGLDPHAQALITELYRKSWFTVDGVRRP